MNSHRLAAVAVATLVLSPLVTSPLVAQRVGSSIAILGGPSFPIGDFGDVAKSGFAAGVQVAMRPESSPVSLRLGALFNRFDAKGGRTTSSRAHSDVLAFTANGAYAPGTYESSDDGERLRPYVTAGVGFYTLRASGGGSSATTSHFGLNGGGGIDQPLGDIAVFLEARLHYVFTEGTGTAFVPLVVGVRFRPPTG